MKKTLLSLGLFFWAQMGLAATYYVSNAGNDANAGLSPASPWQTLAKVNATTFTPGDQILFNRGDTFYGSLLLSQSSLTVDAYGAGPLPVITGFSTVSAWNNLGGNIWESAGAVSALATCCMVTVNGVNTPMGKFPNEGDANKGYVFFQSHSGKTSLTSTSLTGGPNWTGAEVVVRSNQYVLDRRVITSHSGGTITWGTDVNLADGQPFFIQNHPQTLDQQNEWFYDPTTHRIRIYSIAQPGDVKVASVENLITFNKNSYNWSLADHVSIKNLRLTGANNTAIFGYPSLSAGHKLTGLSITDCEIQYVGYRVTSFDVTGLNIENNAIADSNGDGIKADNSKNAVIRNNAISNVALNKGMTLGWGATSAISIASVVNALVEYNTVTNCGYDGINFSYTGTDQVTIKNNFIDKFCLVLNDGGGIYGNKNTKITGNIVMNGAWGQIKLWVFDPWAVGIYLDDNASNNEVSGNTVVNCDRVGILLHNAWSNSVHDNLCFNNKYWQLYTIDDALAGKVENNTIANNILVSMPGNMQTVQYNWGDGSAATIGTLSGNYYCRPVNEGAEIRSNNQNYTIAQWQAVTGQDGGSHNSPKAASSEADIQFEYNNTTSDRVVALAQPMLDMKGTLYTGSVTLPSFSSIVLLKSGVAAPSVPPNLAVTTVSATPIDASTNSSSNGVAVADNEILYRGVVLAISTVNNNAYTGLTAAIACHYSALATMWSAAGGPNARWQESP
jgi:parallel beta-helix repeat protein